MLEVTNSLVLGVKPHLQALGGFSGGYGGGSVVGGQFGNFLAQMKSLGVFDYMLPFLLIFALVFSIMSRINLFGKSNKGVDTVISLAVALMSLQFGFVSRFFTQIFPIFGAVLGILLLAVILMGFVGDKNSNMQKWIFTILAIISLLVVIFNSLSITGALQSQGLQYVWAFLGANILPILLIIGFIVAIVATIKGTLGGGAPSPPNAPAVLLPQGQQGNNG